MQHIGRTVHCLKLMADNELLAPDMKLAAETAHALMLEVKRMVDVGSIKDPSVEVVMQRVKKAYVMTQALQQVVFHYRDLTLPKPSTPEQRTLYWMVEAAKKALEL